MEPHQEAAEAVQDAAAAKIKADAKPPRDAAIKLAEEESEAQSKAYEEALAGTNTSS